MAERTERTHSAGPPALLALWTGILLPPVAFLVNLQVSYMLVPYACGHGEPVWLHLSALLFVMVAVVAGLLARRDWRRAGEEWPDERGDVVTRSRFMAVAGMLSAAFFAILMIGQWIANVIIRPCQ